MWVYFPGIIFVFVEPTFPLSANPYGTFKFLQSWSPIWMKFFHKYPVDKKTENLDNFIWIWRYIHWHMSNVVTMQKMVQKSAHREFNIIWNYIINYDFKIFRVNLYGYRIQDTTNDGILQTIYHRTPTEYKKLYWFFSVFTISGEKGDKTN